MSNINIVIILGSVRVGRETHKVTTELKKRFHAAGFGNTQVLDLAKYNLPIAEERFGKTPTAINGIDNVQAILAKADAFVFVSPEYHGSYSGVLKNFLDYFGDEFKRKPIGVVSVSTGRFGGINASTEMQLLVLALGAFPMPLKLLVPTVHFTISEEGEVKEDFLNTNFNKFVQEFSWFATAIVSHKK